MDQVNIRIPTLVLKKILKFMENKFLAKTCRLVSKEWNRESCIILRLRVTVKFERTLTLNGFCDTFAKSVADLSLNISCFQFPLKFFCQQHSPQVHNDLRKFTEISGEHVRSLTFFACFPLIHVTKEQKRHSLFMARLAILYKIICEDFRNLEILNLSLWPTNGCPISKDFPGIRSAMKVKLSSRKFPQLKLKKLQIRFVDSRRANNGTGEMSKSEVEACRQFVGSLLDASKDLERFEISANGTDWQMDRMAVIEPSVISNVKYLGLESDGLSAAHFRSLASSNFPRLECLHIKPGMHVSVMDIVGLLMRHKKTLKQFHLTLKLRGGHPAMEFPPWGIVLEGLEDLRLSAYSGSVRWENMPTLRSVHFEDVNIVQRNLFPPTLPDNFKLQSFQMNLSMKGSSHRSSLANVYPTIVTPDVPLWFSNVSVLILEKVDFDLPHIAIFSSCRRLRKLQISAEYSSNLRGCGLTDEVMCGISTKGLIKVERGCCGGLPKKDSLTVEQAYQVIEAAKMLQRPAPNISNLTDLQELRLWGNFPFTDYSVMFGVVLCSKLMRLQLNTENLTRKSNDIIKCGLSGLVETYIKHHLTSN